MFQGNWKCSVCGGAITELPFEPRSEAGLTCRDCYFKKKDGGSSAGNGAQDAQDAQSATTAPPADEQMDAPPFDPDAGNVADAPAPPPPDELDGATQATPGERKMFQGDWQCSICGGSISQLPFEPRNTENLKCIDCFKAGK